MRVVRVGYLRQYFTSNELSGWPDGIQYSYFPKKRKVKVVEETLDIEPPKVVRVTSGELLRHN